MTLPAEQMQALIKSRVQVNEETGCWEWRSSIRNRDYGAVVDRKTEGGTGKTLRAHRASYEAFVGPIPEGLFVCHHCDNKPCVNPYRLFVGTAKDNSQDYVKKGFMPYGEKKANAKLTDAAVLQAKGLRLQGWTYQRIADLLGVNIRTAIFAVRGDHWKHLPTVDLPPTPFPKKQKGKGKVGVHWSSELGKWRSSIWIKGRFVHLGTFDLQDDAVKAREAAEKIHGGNTYK